MDKGELDSKEINTITSFVVDQSSIPGNDFFELVCENGQISVLGQSSRARKIPTFKNLPDEELLAWLNYGMDEYLQHDYSSNFLDELSGVTMNDFTLLDKSSSNQVFRDSYRNSSSSSLDQCQSSFASSFRSGVSNITENTACNVGETTQKPSASSGFSSLVMEKQDPIMSSNSSTIMNFSHFARPAAIVKASLQNIDMGNKNKGTSTTTVVTTSYPDESTKVFSGECPKETAIHTQHVMELSNVDLKPLEPKSLEANVTVSKQFDPTCKDVSKIDRTTNLVPGESGSKEQEVVEKRMEQAVASSPVCCGNAAKRCSHDPIQSLKRKRRDDKDPEDQSEDVEEEPFGVKKVARARDAIGSKRSRSAEVHNLSERKRRDRINEKMRALQELIPNCNKVDKASMLDEAIEYLKTLQLQVQIMSMGAGLYMPTMMVPVAMQHLQAPDMAPFSPMAVGMQMSYGMRMPHDINGEPSRFSMAQVPRMQGTHSPASYMSGSIDLNGMARSNPSSMPCSPFFPFQGESLMNSLVPRFSVTRLGATTGLMETVDSASASSLKNPMPNVSSQAMQNTVGNQSGAMNAGFEHSALVNNSGHASEANDIRTVNPD